MAELQKNLTDWKPWAGLFVLGIIIGLISYRYLGYLLVPYVMSIVEDSAAVTSGLSSIGWLGFYIFKNGLVGLLCVLTGRITWGVYPFLVIMVNSVLLGCMALLLNDVQGVSALSFFAGIAPHGIVEIFAICLSCALGMRPGKMREKLVMFAKPFGLLLIAAAIETFISPLIIARVL